LLRRDFDAIAPQPFSQHLPRRVVPGSAGVTLLMIIMSDRQYCVYIMTNVHHTVLYTGVTNNLQRRVLEHREGKTGFTKKYNITKLVFFECGDDINTAITREKQIKGGSRKKKIELINRMNPEWKDLFEEYFGNKK
jgi:putative endonuclease